MIATRSKTASRACALLERSGVVFLALGLLTTAGCATLRSQLFPPSVPTASASASAQDRDARADSVCREGAAATAERVHVVSDGESLSAIAAHYRVSVWDLYAKNDLDDPNRIEVSQRLLLPSDAIVPTEPLRVRPNPRASSRATILLAEAEAHYRAARFDQALAVSQEARLLMEAESDRSTQLARAAFLAGSALAGLGDEQRASAEFRRVHALDDRFEPPDGWLSPRLAVLYGDGYAR